MSRRIPRRPPAVSSGVPDLAPYLPDGMAVWLAVSLVIASLATSMLSAATGLGGGSAMFAVLALVLPPPALVPVHGVLQLGANLGRCVLTRSHLRPVAFGTFAASSVVGAAIGGLVAVRIPQDVMLIGFGMFILWMAWGRIPQALQNAGMLAGGAVSSVLTMFVGATGPFVAAILKPLIRERLSFVAVHSGCMSIQHTIKLIVFGVLGFAFSPYIPLVAVMLVSGFLGTYLGKRILVRLGDDRFYKILNAILTIAALRIIWTGLGRILGSG